MTEPIGISRRSLLVGITSLALAACGRATPPSAPTRAGDAVAARLPHAASASSRPPAPPTAAAASAVVELIWQTDGAPDRLRSPTGLAVDRQGVVTVVDGERDRLICLSADTGAVLATHGLRGTAPGQFRFASP